MENQQVRSEQRLHYRPTCASTQCRDGSTSRSSLITGAKCSPVITIGIREASAGAVALPLACPSQLSACVRTTEIPFHG